MLVRSSAIQYQSPLQSVPAIFDYLNLADSLNYIFTSKQAYQLFRAYCGDIADSRRFNSYLHFIKYPHSIANNFIQFIHAAVEPDKKLQLVTYFQEEYWFIQPFDPRLNKFIANSSVFEIIKKGKLNISMTQMSLATLLMGYLMIFLGLFMRLQRENFLHCLETLALTISKEKILYSLKTTNDILNVIFNGVAQEDYLQGLAYKMLSIGISITVFSILYLLGTYIGCRTRYIILTLKKDERYFSNKVNTSLEELKDELELIRLDEIKELVSAVSEKMFTNPRQVARIFLQNFSKLTFIEQSKLLIKLLISFETRDFLRSLTETDIDFEKKLKLHFSRVIAASINMSDISSRKYVTDASCRIFKKLPTKSLASKVVKTDFRLRHF